MSRSLGSNRSYERRRPPSGRAARRAWKGCDPKTGAPLNRSPVGRIRTIAEAALAPDVARDIRRAEFNRQLRALSQREPWTPFDDDLFNRR